MELITSNKALSTEYAGRLVIAQVLVRKGGALRERYGVELIEKKKGKKIGGSKGKKSKKGFFSKIFGSK